MQSVLLYLFGMCRRRCPHRPADLPEDSDFLVQPHRNRSAEFARCTRCPPGACQRRLPIMLDFMEEPLGMCRRRCPHRPADLPKDSDFLVQPHRNRPAEFARTSLSAWGLPTPVVALACIGNVDIRLFFLCKWVTLFHTAFASLSVYRLSCTTGFTRSYASFFLY